MQTSADLDTRVEAGPRPLRVAAPAHGSVVRNRISLDRTPESLADMAHYAIKSREGCPMLRS
jgi:hypothetical protein